MPSSVPVAIPLAAPAAVRCRFDWAVLNPLVDLQVRNGLKTGLAAVLALWIAQVLRLEHPNWSVLAVLVLANAQYVGAIATKAAMRSLGTIVGALLGIWIVGDYANTPYIFLFWTFVVVAIATYKFGQLGSAAVPYAYYLVGLALVSAATYGITDPDNVWRIALSRTVETLVGVATGTFVFSVLWPRYAREEFVALAGETVRTIRKVLGVEARAYTGEAVDPDRVLDLRRVFDQQILGLRAMLIVGGRGSLYFRSRLGNYQRSVVALTHLFQALLELQRCRAEEAPLLELVRPQIDAYLAALDADLAVLGNAKAASRNLPPVALNEAFAALEARITELREQGTFRQGAIAAGQAFFGHFAALRQTRDELNTVHQLVGELPRKWLPPAATPKRHTVLPAVDWFWVREAVKGGLAVCLSFLLLRWVHPPGATGVPLGAWVFSTFGRMSLQTGGKGDVRTFQRMFLTALTGIPLVALLWLLMPLLSNYWAMNTLLFVLCYGFGFVAARSAGMSYVSQVLLLITITLVAINPQEPVTFAALRDAFLGLLIGVVLGGAVSRLVWPVLPQGVLRANLVRFFEDLRTLLRGAERQEYILTGTVSLPLEALRSASDMVFPACAASERLDLANFIRLALPLGMQIAALQADKAGGLPGLVSDALREPLTSLDGRFEECLCQLANGFRRRDGRQTHFPDLGESLRALDAALTRVRDEGIVAREDLHSVAHLLELTDRYHSIAERLSECRDRLGKLCLERYLHDVAL